MGLALLPWERLHPYILGPLLCVLNSWLFFSETTHPFSSWAREAAGFLLGVGLIWFRYRKDSQSVEPADQEQTHKDIRLGDE